MSKKIMNSNINENMNVQELQKLNKQGLINLLISNVQSSENNKSKPNKQTVKRLSKSGNNIAKRTTNKNNGVTKSIQQRNAKTAKSVPKNTITKSDRIRRRVEEIKSESMNQVMEGIKLDKKYEKLFEDKYKDVFNLNFINLIPMKKVSLFDMKNSEKLLTQKYETKYRSFVDMFENRIMKLKGKRKRISVTIDVKIRSGNREADYDEQNKKKNQRRVRYYKQESDQAEV